MLKHTRRVQGRQHRQRGLSLIELMVGITIGMIVTAGAVVMMVNQVAEHRRLILETQVQQDLRAAADLMLRDLRRAGYWARPENGIATTGSSTPANGAVSQYDAIDVADPQQIRYSYSSSNENPSGAISENDSLDANETFGFRLASGILQFNLGGNWQPLTDPATLTITGLTITPTVQEIELKDYCSSPCPAGANCPRQQIRRINIALTGQATHDSRVVRNVAISSRIRNDRTVGSCP